MADQYLKASGSAVVVAAHPDDEVLGCGGTIARLASRGVDVHILLMADGETSRSNDTRKVEQAAIAARYAAAEAARAILGAVSTEVMCFADNRMDTSDLLDVVQAVEQFINKHSPRAVFTHHGGDVNIDHRIVHDAVIAACRPTPGHPVRELRFFEVPSSTEWRPPGSALSFNPNSFVDITGALETKLRALEAYSSELRPFPHPRSVEAVTALARWRGASAGVNAAEAFVLGRELL